MNISVKVCDFCDTCVYEGEYEIQNSEVKCFMCIEEEKDETPSHRSKMNSNMGDKDDDTPRYV